MYALKKCISMYYLPTNKALSMFPNKWAMSFVILYYTFAHNYVLSCNYVLHLIIKYTLNIS